MSNITRINDKLDCASANGNQLAGYAIGDMGSVGIERAANKAAETLISYLKESDYREQRAILSGFVALLLDVIECQS